MWACHVVPWYVCLLSSQSADCKQYSYMEKELINISQRRFSTLIQRWIDVGISTLKNVRIFRQLSKKRWNFDSHWNFEGDSMSNRRRYSSGFYSASKKVNVDSMSNQLQNFNDCQNVPAGISLHNISEHLSSIHPHSKPSNWVQCDRCQQWRKLPTNANIVAVERITEWFCEMNPDPNYRLVYTHDNKFFKLR